MIRIVIVDDEPPARRKLRRLLSGDPDFQVVAEAGTGAEAVCVLDEHHPELAFLDIQLPDCTGFDVAAQMAARDRTHLVFVTAYDDFALQAFNVHALDYLLKPVEPSRFEASLARVKRFLASGKLEQLSGKLEELLVTLQTSPTYARRVLVQEQERTLFLETQSIDWMESARNYVCLYCGGKTYIVRSTLDAFQSKLNPREFQRINRSQIVNTARIAEVRQWFHGDQKLVLQDGTELHWSRRYRVSSLAELV